MKNPNPIILITLTGGTTYQEYINTFFADNYDELFEICIKDTRNTVYDPNELLAELLVFLHSKEEKIRSLVQIEGKADKGLMRYCGQWCFNQIRLYSANGGLSNFQARHQLKPAKTSIGEKCKQIPNVVYDESHKNIFDYVVQNCLDVTEKALYDIYVIQGKKVAEIKRLVPALGKFPIYKMIRELKAKIKAECELLIKESI